MKDFLETVAALSAAAAIFTTIVAVLLAIYVGPLALLGYIVYRCIWG